MISQLGLVAPIGSGPSAQADPIDTRNTAAARAQVSARGETSVADGLAVTARAVEAPRQADRASALVPDLPSTLLPPNPDAPTGPPPAFEASLLDRQREEALSGRADRAPAPTVYDAPPTAAVRAEAGLSALREIAVPYDTSTVDVLK